MTLAELMNLLNATRTRLFVVNGKLQVDAPARAMTTEMRTALAKHREIILAALATSIDSMPTVDQVPDVKEDAGTIPPRLLGWLEYLAAEYECGTVYGTNGKTWHVRAIVGRLLLADINDRWIEEASDFYEAMRAARPSLLTMQEIEARDKARELNADDTRELQAILVEFAEAMETRDQGRVDEVWHRLNELNTRTGRAKRSNLPRVLKGEGATSSSAATSANRRPSLVHAGASFS